MKEDILKPAIIVLLLISIWSTNATQGGNRTVPTSPLSSRLMQSGRMMVNVQQFLADGQRHVKLADIMDDAVRLLTATISDVASQINNPLITTLDVLQKLNLLLPANMSEPCQKSLRMILYKTANVSLSDDFLHDWALSYFDSQGKISSGIFRGNGLWLGDFGECVSIAVSREEAQQLSSDYRWPTEDPLAFVGQYCLLSVKMPSHILDSVQVKVDGKPGMITANDLALKYGSCFPSTCTTTDISTLIAKVPIINKLDISFEYGYCQKAETELDTMGVYLTVLFLCPVLGVIVATLYDYIDLGSNPEQKLKADLPNLLSRYHEGSFSRRCVLLLSWRKTFHKLFVSEVEGKAFAFIHGLRFLSILWVILGHAVLGMLIFPFENLMDAFDLKEYIIIQIGANGFYSVDTFLFLGGFSFAYFLLEDFKTTQVPANVFLYYVGRFTRLLPSLILVQIIVAGPYMALSNGPLWPASIDFLTTQCRKGWWEDLLFISNFKELHSVCIFGDWYLAVDSQLFLIAVPLVVLMSRKPKFGVALCGALIVVSLSISVYLFTFLNLKSFHGFTSSRAEVEKYANQYYQVPWTRMAIYLQGIILGYYLQQKGVHNVNMSRKVVALGWIVCLVVMGGLIFGTFPWFRETPMPHYLQVIHGIFSKPLWGLTLVWVVLACATENGGILNSFLSLRIFWPLGRLSYCIFLTHGLVISYFMASVASPIPFKVTTFAVWFIAITVTTIAVSIVIYGLVEGPVGDARKVFIKPFMDAKYATKAGFKSLSTHTNKPRYRVNGTKHLIDEETLS